MLDSYSIIVFFCLLLVQNKEFRSRKNIMIAIVSVVIISIIDLKFNLASLFLLPLVFFGGYRKKQIGLKKNVACFIKAFLPSLIATNTSGILTLTVIANFSIDPRIKEPLFIVFNIFMVSIISYFINAVFINNNHYRRYYDDIWTQKVFFYVGIFEIISMIWMLTISRITRFSKGQLENMFFIFFFVLLFLTISIWIILKLHISKIELNYEKQRINDTSKYMAELEDNYQEMRQFKHEYRNLLISIHAIAKSGNNEKIILIIENILKEERGLRSVERANLLNNLEDSALKGLVMSKLYDAKKNNVNLRIEINTKIEDLGSDTLVMSKVMGIVIDNAIEAASESEDKNVNLTMVRDGANIGLELENSFDNNVPIRIDSIFNPGYTTKGPSRGMGLTMLKGISDSNERILIRLSIQSNMFKFYLYMNDVYNSVL